jgi:hypothetical protein
MEYWSNGVLEVILSELDKPRFGQSSDMFLYPVNVIGQKQIHVGVHPKIPENVFPNTPLRHHSNAPVFRQSPIKGQVKILAGSYARILYFLASCNPISRKASARRITPTALDPRVTAMHFRLNVTISSIARLILSSVVTDG